MTISATFTGSTASTRPAGQNKFSILSTGTSDYKVCVTHGTGPKGGESNNSIMVLYDFAEKLNRGEFDSDPDFYTVADLYATHGSESYYRYIIGGLKVTISTETTPRDLIMPIVGVHFVASTSTAFNATSTPPYRFVGRGIANATPPDNPDTFLVASPNGLVTHADASTTNITDVDGTVSTMDTFDDMLSIVWHFGNTAGSVTGTTLDYSSDQTLLNDYRTGFTSHYPYMSILVPSVWLTANTDFNSSNPATKDVEIIIKTYETYLNNTGSSAAKSTYLKMSDGADQTGNSFLPPGTFDYTPRSNPTSKIFEYGDTDITQFKPCPETVKEAPVAAMVHIDEAHTYTQAYWYSKGLQYQKKYQAQREANSVDWYFEATDIVDLDAIVAPHRTLELLEDGDFEIINVEAGVIPYPGGSGGGGGGGSTRPTSGLLYPRGDRC